MKPFAHPKGTLAAFREHLNATVTPGDPGAEAWQAARPGRPFGDWLYAADRPGFEVRLRRALASGRWKFVRKPRAPRPKAVKRAAMKAATLAKAEQAARLRTEGDGMTLQEVGDALGVTREYARKLCDMAGAEKPAPKPRRQCRRPKCRRPAAEYCCGCRSTAKSRGVDPGELPPVGEIAQDWCGWRGTVAQVEAARANAAKARVAHSKAGRARRSAKRKAKRESKDLGENA